MDDITGQMHFVDLLTSDEIAKMKLVPATAMMRQDLMSWIPCTTHLFTSFEETSRYKKISRRILPKLGRLQEKYPELGPVFGMGLQWKFLQTAIPLPQLRDAAGVAPEFQFQGAYFEEGMVFFQQQFLPRITDDELEALIWKESLRYLSRVMMLPLENQILQDTVKLLMKEDAEALVQGPVFRIFQASMQIQKQLAEKRTQERKAISSVPTKDEFPIYITLIETANKLTGMVLSGKMPPKWILLDVKPEMPNPTYWLSAGPGEAWDTQTLQLIPRYSAQNCAK